ncbi:MBL fold metallo-hydrolase [Nafulsella turpanensis]|uniref:MBL fold metallo-hydrolase n=1 Tax=Nafulsella turpanensis TaxID=1265690 RepID=UPI0003460C63|nr:MBL fold metallo-hydrolase [Nafulsella turpanensis]
MNKFFILPILLLLHFPVHAQPDTIQTGQGELIITPIQHGSLVLEYQGKTIYVDPYGGGKSYQEVKEPDLVLITDIHGDHLHEETLKALSLEKADFIVPAAVKEKLGEMELSIPEPEVLANGEQTSWEGIQIEAIPMYNLPETSDSRHPKGRGNGYVLSFDGTRVYISGDTEAIPEMRALKDIDVAFVPMNLPYTMDIQQAAEGVLAFAPEVIYPYHYKGSDVEAFKQKVESQNPNIEVRLREWY